MIGGAKSLIRGLSFMMTLSLCLLLIACENVETQSSKMSDDANTFVFDANNIIGLKSISLSNEGQNGMVIEFDDDSRYISLEVLENILSAMQERPDDVTRRIIGESEKSVVSREIQVEKRKKSVCLKLLFDSDDMCDHIEIGLRGCIVDFYGPWDSPKLEVMDYTYIKDGVKGTRFLDQTFDKEKQIWNEVHEDFYEDKEPVGD